MKKIILSITAALSFLVASQAYGTSNFSDINSHWAKESITTAVSKGYVDGYPDGTFKPDANVTRAEFIKLAVDAMGYKKSTSLSVSSAWYGPFLDAAIANGLSEKDEFADFDGAITRGEMSRLAVRGTGQANYDPLKWMYLATSKGIINGLDDQGTLGEDQPTTRAQAITVIERMLKLKAGEKLSTDKYATSAAEIVWHKTNIFTMMPQFFDINKQFPANTWKSDNLFVQTADGNYRGELDGLVAIDLGDPNDPNIGLLPDMDTLRWHNLVPRTKGYPVKDYMDSYVLYFQGRTVYNYDESIYVKGDSLNFSISGIQTPDRQAFVKGDLNQPGSIFINQLDDVPAVIIPKSGYKLDSEIKISLLAPVYGGNNVSRKYVVRVATDPTE
ncbi:MULTISPECIES: S-layer homology domain-containing protein [unclassified Paenibacillus]|uniref:S-layer homology domain-containing protein n=1 Tax=unclassified Paenibacillus TaxID=185978 RepID=UPI003631F6A7